MSEDNDKTQIFNYGNSSSKKRTDTPDETRALKAKEDDDKTVYNKDEESGAGGGDQTIILGKENAGNKGKRVAKRKLVGWLVSFTLDEAGTDFRLFEGKNKLGRSRSNDIRIFQDGKISGEHAVILYRGDDFYVKDELASNPSFLNDKEIAPGETVKVQDGDELKFGDHVYTLRKA